MGGESYTRGVRVRKEGGEGNFHGWNEEKRVTAGLYLIVPYRTSTFLVFSFVRYRPSVRTTKVVYARYVARGTSKINLKYRAKIP